MTFKISKPQKIIKTKSLFQEIFSLGNRPEHQVGICLSGGSARGYAHIGVLKALHEHGVKPTVISGTSMGAVVGVLYAAGYSPGGIKKILVEETFSKMTGFSWRRTGLYKLEKMKLALEKYISEDDFSVLKKPFYLGLSNLNDACGEIRSSGPLFDYLIASCSVPGVFAPIVLDKINYVDGGLMCNLPASAIRDKCKYLIGSHVNFAGKKELFTGPKGILERSINLGITQNARPEMEICDFLIDPPAMQNFTLFDFSRIEDIIETGYTHTIEMIKKGELPVRKLQSRKRV
ncbi:patatin-like phospholipase family protein [Salinimicrobium oceani]|uniref:Patatin-like phospholipase family protein n=1 Tax=Salinimicrobium oceani TaxID=2722702 RepID=A0ABX1CU44_9FLAO|nr:patatin-like phospholipase family protein [Salinimicrobium oceani]NJW51815.1 patatin-like phospholipase family protein [Salinimicrobium oceani]